MKKLSYFLKKIYRNICQFKHFSFHTIIRACKINGKRKMRKFERCTKSMVNIPLQICVRYLACQNVFLKIKFT